MSYIHVGLRRRINDGPLYFVLRRCFIDVSQINFDLRRCLLMCCTCHWTGGSNMDK